MKLDCARAAVHHDARKPTCWLQKMKVGEKAQLTCPSEAAYGDQGHPPTIPGGATLVFDVELLEVAGK